MADSHCPTDALGRSKCAGLIRTALAAIAADMGRNCEVTVSTAPPLVANPYSTGYACPHGVLWWVEPTGEQIVEWNRDGVR